MIATPSCTLLGFWKSLDIGARIDHWQFLVKLVKNYLLNVGTTPISRFFINCTSAITPSHAGAMNLLSKLLGT
jgi:hypothetical protein